MLTSPFAVTIPLSEAMCLDKRSFALWLGFRATLSLVILCALLNLREAYAQTTSPPVLSREPEVTDLIIQPTDLSSNGNTLTAPPAMPPFARPILTPSQQLIDRAKGLLGIPYKFAGSNPDTGFDCSGLVRFVFRDVLGISLPGRAEEIGRGGEKLNDGHLSPGDLVFFNTLNRPLSHVGIYLGNRQFLHAPASGGVVRIESMALPYWTKRYQGARRMVSQESQVSTVAGITPELAHGVEILAGDSGVKPGEVKSPERGHEKLIEVNKSNEPARSSDTRPQESGKNPDQLDLFLKKLKEKP